MSEVDSFISSNIGIITFLILFILKIFEKIFQRKLFTTKLEKIKESTEAMRKLRKHADQFNSPDTFVKFARIQREANMYEKRLDGLWKELKSYPQCNTARIFNSLNRGFMLLCVLVFWNKSIITLTFKIPYWTKILIGFPHNLFFVTDTYSIYIMPWIFFSNKAIHAALETMLPTNVKYLELTKKLQRC